MLNGSSNQDACLKSLMFLAKYRCNFEVSEDMIIYHVLVSQFPLGLLQSGARSTFAGF